MRVKIKISKLDNGYESADEIQNETDETEKCFENALSAIAMQLDMLKTVLAQIDEKITNLSAEVKSRSSELINAKKIHSPRSTSGRRRRSSAQEDSLEYSPTRGLSFSSKAAPGGPLVQNILFSGAASSSTGSSVKANAGSPSNLAAVVGTVSPTPRIFSLSGWRKPVSLNSSPTAVPKSNPSSGTTTPNTGSDYIVSPRSMDIDSAPITLTGNLGCGATARVFEANVAGAVLAAKVYHQYFNSGTSRKSEYAQVIDRECSRLTKNVNILCALQSHPNVLTTLSWRIERNQLIVLSERVHCALSELLERSAPLQDIRIRAKSTLRVILHVARALAFFANPKFARGSTVAAICAIIHRDIKTENILCRHVIPSGENLCTCIGSSCSDWQHYDFVVGDFDEAHVIYRENFDTSAIDWVPANSLFINGVRPTEQQQSLASAASAEHLGAAKTLDLAISECCKSEPSLSKTVKDALRTSLGGSSNSSAKNTGFIGSNTNTGTNTLSDSPRCAKSNRAPKTFGDQKMVERLDLCVGTLEYMAPEMANQCSAYYDASVDIWSLGMVIYELMTLTPPHGLLPGTADIAGSLKSSAKFSRFELHDIVARGVLPEIPKSVLDESKWARVLEIYAACTAIDYRKRMVPSSVVAVCEGLLLLSDAALQ